MSSVLKAGLKKEGDGEKLDLGIVCELYLPLVLLPGSQGFLRAECAQMLALLSGPGTVLHYAPFHWSSFMCPPVQLWILACWPAHHFLFSEDWTLLPVEQPQILCPSYFSMSPIFSLG